MEPGTLPEPAVERVVARYGVMAWLAAAVMAGAVCFSLVRIPIQVPDSLVVMLQVQAAPSASLTNFVGERGFLRPVYMAQTRLLLDAARGEHYVLVFRGFHVALVIVLFVLFVRALRVQTKADFAAFALALVVLTGHHTFRGNVWESYPVNHYLEVAILSLAALVVHQSRGGWWADLLACVLFAAAAMTLESGLIVWVVIVAGWLVGMRGISWRGVALVTVLLAAYFFVRFAYLETGSPELIDRATGFGFGRLERAEVAARFADAPWVLYAYNILSSILSVLFSEPRGGTFEMTRQWVERETTPSTLVGLTSSLITTGLLIWFVVRRFGAWTARRFEAADRAVIVFLAVTAANAAISYVYVKDEIMSTAGVFYAVAVFAAARELLGQCRQAPRRAYAASALVLVLGVASLTWTIRAVGLHYHMYYSAYYLRNEWATVDDWLREQHVETTDQGRVLVQSLRAAAIRMPARNPHFLPRWAGRWFG